MNNLSLSIGGALTIPVVHIVSAFGWGTWTRTKIVAVKEQYANHCIIPQCKGKDSSLPFYKIYLTHS